MDMKKAGIGVGAALLLVVAALTLSGKKGAAPPPESAPQAAQPVSVPAVAPKLDAESLARLRNAAKGDPEGEVRWAAAELLLKLEDAEALIILENMVAQDGDPAVRRRAVDAVGALNEPATTLPLFVEALKDMEAEVRAAALRQLARQGDAATLPYINPLTRDTDPSVRAEASKAAEAVRRRSGGAQ